MEMFSDQSNIQPTNTCDVVKAVFQLGVSSNKKIDEPKYLQNVKRNLQDPQST